MRRIAIALGLLTAQVARAEPVDPAKLAAITAPAKGTGELVVVQAAGVPADVLLLAVGGPDFAMVAGARSIEGRIGDGKGVPASAAFDALAAGLEVVRLRRGPARTAHPIDLSIHHARTFEILRLLADVAGVGIVFAPQHEVPPITVRSFHGDPREVARSIAKLVGLELIDSHDVWVFAEPGTKLDAKLAATTHAGARLVIHRAHPGEARRLLEPDEPQDRNVCPKDTWIDASLRGQIGVLEAVLGTFSGAPCEQRPSTTELDTATATLVGILIEPKLRRAVFRVPHGARAFEPNNEQRIEISYVQLEGDRTASLHPAVEHVDATTDAPGPFSAPDAHTWHLRGTLRLGARWRAIFESRGEWRVGPGAGMFAIGEDHPIELGAGTATVKNRAYALER